MARTQNYDDGIDDCVRIISQSMASLPASFDERERLAATGALAGAGKLMREFQFGKQTLRMFAAKPKKSFWKFW